MIAEIDGLAACAQRVRILALVVCQAFQISIQAAYLALDVVEELIMQLFICVQRKNVTFQSIFLLRIQILPLTMDYPGFNLLEPPILALFHVNFILLSLPRQVMLAPQFNEALNVS